MPWVAGGGGTVFGLVWFLLSRYDLQRVCFSKMLTGKIARSPKQVLARKKSSFTEAFYHHFFKETYKLNIFQSCCLTKQESAYIWTPSPEAMLMRWPVSFYL